MPDPNGGGANASPQSPYSPKSSAFTEARDAGHSDEEIVQHPAKDTPGASPWRTRALAPRAPMSGDTKTMKPRKLTKRQREREQQEREKWAERLARIERHEKLLADGYVLIRGRAREHPAHSVELPAGRPSALHRSRQLRTELQPRRQAQAGSAVVATGVWKLCDDVPHEPDWWQANTGQYAIVFPADAPPPPTTVPAPVYVKDGSVLPYEPF